MIIQSKTGELAQPAQKFSAREKNDAQRLFLIRKQIQRFDDTVVGGGRPGIKFLEKAPHGTWSRHIAFALTTGESRGNEAGDGIGRFRKTCVYRSAPASRLLRDIQPGSRRTRARRIYFIRQSCALVPSGPCPSGFFPVKNSPSGASSQPSAPSIQSSFSLSNTAIS